MPISYDLHSKQEQPSGLILPNTLVRPIQQDPYAARQGSLVAKDCDSDRRCISEHPDSYRHAPCTHWEREAGRPPSQPGCAATTSQLPSARNADGPLFLPWQPLPPPPPPPQAHWDTNPPADLVSEEALEPVQTHRVAEFAQAAASEQIILRIGTPSDSESKAGQRPLSAPRPLARRALHGRHDLRCHSLDLFCLDLTRGLGLHARESRAGAARVDSGDSGDRHGCPRQGPD